MPVVWKLSITFTFSDLMHLSYEAFNNFQNIFNFMLNFIKSGFIEALTPTEQTGTILYSNMQVHSTSFSKISLRRNFPNLIVRLPSYNWLGTFFTDALYSRKQYYSVCCSARNCLILLWCVYENHHCKIFTQNWKSNPQFIDNSVFCCSEFYIMVSLRVEIS